jgi:hypothetical protein
MMPSRRDLESEMLLFYTGPGCMAESSKSMALFALRIDNLSTKPGNHKVLAIPLGDSHPREIVG